MPEKPLEMSGRIGATPPTFAAQSCPFEKVVRMAQSLTNIDRNEPVPAGPLTTASNGSSDAAACAFVLGICGGIVAVALFGVTLPAALGGAAVGLLAGVAIAYL